MPQPLDPQNVTPARTSRARRNAGIAGATTAALLAGAGLYAVTRDEEARKPTTLASSSSEPTQTAADVLALAPFVDEFDGATGSKPDSRYWYVYDGPGTKGTNGVRRPENVFLENGRLVIESEGSNVGGLCFCGDGTDDFSFGDYVIEGWITKGGGTSAIGLWPDNENFPEGGEIDIAEVTSTERDKIYTTLHFALPNGSEGQTQEPGVAIDASQRVLMKLEWRPASIRVLFNDQLVFEDTNPLHNPFDSKHLFLQMDAPKTDGSWGSPSVAPSRMEIERVEVVPLLGVSVPRGKSDPISVVLEPVGPGFG